MKLLLDEMYSTSVAEQLRASGYDVVSVHDPDYRKLEGAPDGDVFDAAVSEGRALVTENVPDFRLLEAEALARGERTPMLVFTTNRHSPRGDPGTIGRLVRALTALIADAPAVSTATFLKAPPEGAAS